MPTPESQSPKVQILCDQSRCIRCSSCVRACPQKAISLSDSGISIDPDICAGCLQCIHECPKEAFSYEGEYRMVQEVVDICLQDRDFYETSGGGVTISGGEGMTQPEFLEELLTELKQHHIHLAIETTGYARLDIFQRLAPMFDLLLFDVKHYDSNRHLEGTGVRNELIMENLRLAICLGIEVLPRIPVIPDFNASLDDAAGLAALLKKAGAQRVQLLPFHQFGESKYRRLSRKYACENVKALHEDDLADYRQVFLDCGIEAFF